MKFDTLQREIEFLKTLIKLDDKEIIEIGCGSGRLTKLLAPLSKKIIAVDPEEELIKSNEESNSFANVEYHNSSVVNLPFDDETFDLVIFSLSLCCVEPVDHMKTGVIESLRVLKQGGILINIMPYTLRKFDYEHFWYYIDETTMEQIIVGDVALARLALKQVCYIDKKMRFLQEGTISTIWEFDNFIELRDKWISRYDSFSSSNSEEKKEKFLQILDDELDPEKLSFEIHEEYLVFEK